MKLHAPLFRLQHGQAMVEATIASALVLVPLFLAIPVLAKYMDIKCYAEQAARYSTWERTVWFGGAAARSMGVGSSDITSNHWYANEKTDTQIKHEIIARLLEPGSSHFTSNDPTPPTSNSRIFWRDRRGNKLLQDYNATGNSISNNQSPGTVNKLLSPLLNVASVLSNFTLDTHAQYTANVSISTQEVAFNPGTELGGCNNSAGSCSGVDFLATSNKLAFQAKNALVANGWSANGPGSESDYDKGHDKITVYNQTRGLTPTSIIRPTNGVLKTMSDIFKGILTVFLPELSTLDLGKIEVDKVPADRLKQ